MNIFTVQELHLSDRIYLLHYVNIHPNSYPFLHIQHVSFFLIVPFFHLHHALSSLFVCLYFPLLFTSPFLFLSYSSVASLVSRLSSLVSPLRLSLYIFSLFCLPFLPPSISHSPSRSLFRLPPNIATLFPPQVRSTITQSATPLVTTFTPS